MLSEESVLSCTVGYFSKAVWLNVILPDAMNDIYVWLEIRIARLFHYITILTQFLFHLFANFNNINCEFNSSDKVRTKYTISTNHQYV